MMKHRIGVLVVLAALVFCGLALAASPTDRQYGNPTPNGGSPPATGHPGLPFTGFQAGMALLGGFGLLAAGLVLRSNASEKPGQPRLLALPGAEPYFDLAFLTAPIERCEGCGTPLSPMGFRISIGKRRLSYHSVECAAHARARSVRPGVASSFTP